MTSVNDEEFWEADRDTRFQAGWRVTVSSSAELERVFASSRIANVVSLTIQSEPDAADTLLELPLLTCCPRLEELRICRQRIRTLDLSLLGNPKRLRKLEVDNTPVECVRGAALLEGLHRFTIRHGKLRHLPEGLTEARGLVSLDLSNNELRCVQGSLSNLIDIQRFDFTGNPQMQPVKFAVQIRYASQCQDTFREMWFHYRWFHNSSVVPKVRLMLLHFQVHLKMPRDLRLLILRDYVWESRLRYDEWHHPNRNE